MLKTMFKALAATLLLFSGALTAAPEVVELNRVIAVVDETVITERALERRLERTKARLSRQMSELPADNLLRRQLLEQLISERLQLERAKLAGLHINDEDLNSTIANIAAENGLSLQQYGELMASQGLPFAQLREQIRNEMLIAQIRQVEVSNRIAISGDELQLFLQSRAAQENRNVEYLISHILIAVPEAASPRQLAEAKGRAEALRGELLGGADFATQAITQSDGGQALEGGSLGWRGAAQLPSLFGDEVLEMKVGEISPLLRSPSGFHILRLDDKRGEERHMVQQVRARHILISPNALVSPEEAYRRIKSLRERILQGADFAELARAHSEDPGSGNNGGDLGWADPSIYVASFQEALAKLQPGQLSEIITSPFGLHIIELLGRREHDNSEAVRESQARRALFGRKYEEALESWLRRLRDEAYVEYRLEG